MKKFTVAVLTAALALPALPAGASTRLVATPKCEEPVPTRQYDGQAMTYGLSIDLTGCWWWDGSPIQLEATLSRLDGTGEEGSTTVILCGGIDRGDHRAVPDEGEESGRKDDAPDDAPQGDQGDETGRDAPEADEARHGDSGRKVAAASEEARTRRSTCEVATGLDHPPVELARYRGEVTYPWRNDTRKVEFDVLCASPANACRGR